MEMKNKKAILVWSDGIETNYTEYTSTPDKTAVEQAQDQMHKEYQEHGEAMKSVAHLKVIWNVILQQKTRIPADGQSFRYQKTR